MTVIRELKEITHPVIPQALSPNTSCLMMGVWHWFSLANDNSAENYCIVVMM